MPPKRCPECGRFLANEFVSELAETPAPCPRCGTELRPNTIVGGERSRRAKPASDRAEPAEAGTGNPASPSPATTRATTSSADRDPVASIRPPDLDPAEVRTVDDDVLAGWDAGATDEEMASWRADQRPFPTDTVVVLGAALVGGVLAALVSDRDRGRWAAVGALGGAISAGAARRIWELRA